MIVDDFDYDLPAELIAQTPAEPRDSARLLVDRHDLLPGHMHIRDLGSLVGPGDVIVLNNTRVLAARLQLVKSTGGAVEVFLLEPLGDGSWLSLVKPSRRVAVGSTLTGANNSQLAVLVGDRLDGGMRRVEVFVEGDSVEDTGAAHALDQIGQTPLPPYIHRPLDDAERYQTIYSKHLGSVAAPTAGLHLTQELLDSVVEAGAKLRFVELVIGLDTFRPLTVADTDDHIMHSETYRVTDETMAACRDADRVVAIGTTTARALESAALGNLSGRTNLFIQRGYQWRIVDAMLTNFHMPRSTLLVMIDALVGPRWRELYEEAIARKYRFLSFGDAMFVARPGQGDQFHTRPVV